MTMLPGRRNQRGDATDQLQRREDDLGAPVRTRFGQAVDQPLRVELLQPVCCEGRTSAVAQQTLQALAVVGLDAHARIQREKAAGSGFSRKLPGEGVSPRDGTNKPPPWSHASISSRVCASDPPTAHERPQDPSADLGLHDPHRIGVDGLRRDEPDTLLRVGLEHAVDHDDMEERVLVQHGTEPVDEGYRPGACLGTGTQAAAQVVLDRIQKNARGTVEDFAVVLEVIA